MIYLDYHGDSQKIWLFLRTVSFSKKPKNEQKQKKKCAHNLFHLLETKPCLDQCPSLPSIHCLILSTTIHHAYTNIHHPHTLAVWLSKSIHVSSSAGVWSFLPCLLVFTGAHDNLDPLGLSDSRVWWFNQQLSSFCVSVWPLVFQKSTAGLFFRVGG